MSHKTDRFEALVKRYELMGDDANYEAWYISTADASHLLRREHAALVRAVKRRIAEVDRSSQCQENVSYRLALTDVLALLEARKGKR